MSFQSSVGLHTFYNDLAYGGRVGVKVQERFWVYGDYISERAKYGGFSTRRPLQNPTLSISGQYPHAYSSPEFRANPIDVNRVPIGRSIDSRDMEFYHNFSLGGAYRIPGQGRFSYEVYAGAGYVIRNYRTVTIDLSAVRLVDNSELTDDYTHVTYNKATRYSFGANFGGMVFYRLTPNSQLGFDQRIGLGNHSGQFNSMLLLRSNLNIQRKNELAGSGENAPAAELAAAENIEESSLSFRLGLGLEGGYSINHELYGIGLMPSLSVAKNRFSATYTLGQLNYQGNPSNYRRLPNADNGNSSTVGFGFATPRGNNAKSGSFGSAADHSTVFVNRLTVEYDVMPLKNTSIGIFSGYSYRKFRDLTIGADLGLQPLERGGDIDLLVPVDLRYDVWQTELGTRLTFWPNSRLSAQLIAGVSTNFRWSTQLALSAGAQMRLY